MLLRRCILLLFALLAPLTAAPVFEHLAAFEQPGRWPMAQLLYVPGNGNYYGTTTGGGIYEKGTLFRMTPAGVVTTVIHFTGESGAAPGSSPNGKLIIGSDGAIYGVTLTGGGADCGTIFRLTTSGNFTSLVHFNGVNAGLLTPRGSAPNELILHADGSYYGTTQGGGASNAGTIFRMSFLLNLTPIMTTLVNFTGTGGTYKGDSPMGPLAVNGTSLYGVTQYGGSNELGTVFKASTSGGSFSTLLEFTGTAGARPGSHPTAGLTLHSDGILYGTTESGGSEDMGTIFKISTAGAYTNIRHFADTDGAYPAGRLVVGEGLALYGTTSSGGEQGLGTIFKLNMPGTSFESLMSFTGDGGTVQGAIPMCGLSNGAGADLVGSTSGGGLDGEGSIFKISGGVFTSLASFTNANGWEPAGGPATEGADALIVPLKRGGLHGGGVLARIRPGSPVEIAARLGGEFGAEIEGGLSNIGDAIFGATLLGGTSNRGTIFSYAAEGLNPRLLNFTISTGIKPEGPIVEGPDGFLYAVLREGGGYGLGAIVRFDRSGSRHNLISFTGTTGGAPGQAPRAPLAFGADGTIFGVTELGGANNCGTIFSLTSTGTFTLLKEFSTAGLRTPRAGLVKTLDGTFIGSATFGGASNVGGIFKVTESGEMTTLAEFNGTVGAKPSAPVTIAVDGTIYGTTTSGGASGLGTVFRIPVGGTLSRLVSFTGTSGSAPGDWPVGALTFAQDGSLCGVTAYGGAGGGGTVFRIKQLGGHTVTDPATFLLGLPVLNGRTNAGGELTSCYFEYGPTPALGLNTILTPTLVLGGGVTSFQTILLLTTPGQTVYFRAVAVNGSGTTYGQILSFTVPTPLNLWWVQHFGNAVLNLLVDSDGDGKLNLLEYALGTNPTQPDNQQPVATVKQYPEGRFLSILMPRDPARNDITVSVIAGPSLNGPWTVLASSVNGGSFTGPGYVGGDNADATAKQVEIRDIVSTNTAPSRFIRVKVSQ